MAILDDWNGYQKEIEGEPCTVFLNLGLMQRLPLKDKPLLLTVQVRLNPAQQQEEYAMIKIDHALAEMEARVRRQIENQYAGLFAGRVTSTAQRCLYFYVSSQHHDSLRADSVIQSFDGFDGSLDIRPDPEWTFYQDILFPGERDMHLIINHRMVSELAEQGEQGDALRRVDHWIYFKDEGQCAAFVADVKRFEFKVEEEPSAQLDAHSFGVQIWRSEYITYDAIDRLVLFLMDQAARHQGQYDGWEADV